MLQTEEDSEEESYFRLTRAERLLWLEEFLSRPFEDESRRPNITYDNCIVYYPSIDVRLTNWTFRRHLIHLEVNVRIATDNYLFCTYECMYNYFPNYSGDISINSRIVYEIVVFNSTTS